MEAILSITETKRKRIVVCSMAVLIIFFWATASFASWSIEFFENGLYNNVTYNFNMIEVFDVGGTNTTSHFEGPGMSNFSDGSWTVQMPNQNYVLALNSNGGTANFSWLFSLTGDSSCSLHLAYLAYATTGEIFGYYINYNYEGASGWGIEAIDNLDITEYDRTPASAVPLPPSVFLFSGGLLGLVALRKKIKV